MNEATLIVDKNISRAWGRCLIQAVDNPGNSISPLIVSLTSFTDGEPEEDRELRKLLDDCLKAKKKQSIHTVANTIFPKSLWRYAKYDRHELFEIYKDNFPLYKLMEPHKNKRGLYFERMIAFGSGPKDGNQLEWILSQFKPGARKSKYQVAIFDPGRDHVPDAQLGFPCLQHVTFVPDDGRLYVNGFYATQQLFIKAYGNFLGLCRLGHFMSTETKLPLGSVNCIVGVEKLEGISKTDADLAPVLERARNLVAEADTNV